jgi:hypothetical protein
MSTLPEVCVNPCSFMARNWVGPTAIATAAANAATTFLHRAQLISKSAGNCRWRWSPEFSEEKSLRSQSALFLAHLLESRVLADRIPDRVDLQQCRSNRSARGYLQQPRENGNRVIGITQ